MDFQLKDHIVIKNARENRQEPPPPLKEEQAPLPAFESSKETAKNYEQLLRQSIIE